MPIPWKNCGGPSDLLSITQSDASVWPPPVAAPASAVATLDTNGHVVNLRLFLVHGIAWIFDSGPLPSTVSAGFVSLPASFPVTLASPALPIAPGPYSTTRTFGGHGTLPVTIVSKANLASPIDAPVTTTLSLVSDGTPGFPLTSVAGSVYGLKVQMSASGGAPVFCMDINVPFKTAAPFVSVQQASSIPALSPISLMTLASLFAATGVFALRSARGAVRSWRPAATAPVASPSRRARSRR